MQDTAKWIEKGAIAVGDELKRAISDKRFMCGAETVVEGAECGYGLVRDL